MGVPHQIKFRQRAIDMQGWTAAEDLVDLSNAKFQSRSPLSSKIPICVHPMPGVGFMWTKKKHTYTQTDT